MQKRSKTGIVLGLAFGVSAGQALACTSDEVHRRVRADFAMDISTGTVLYERNADARLSQASLTKRMVLYLLLEDIRAGKRHEDDPVTLPTTPLRNASGERQNGDPIEWSIGTVALKDAIFAMNQKSSNRVPQSFETPYFIERMNAKARELGLTGTHFVNTTGFPTRLEKDNENLPSGHYSTARDHAKLVAALYREFPSEMKIFSQPTESFTGWNKSGKPVDYNINSSVHLLPGSKGKRALPTEGVEGGKTGYICKSGHNLDIVANIETGNAAASSWPLMSDLSQKIVFVTFGHAAIGERDRFARNMIENPNRDLEEALALARTQPREYTKAEIRMAVASLFGFEKPYKYFNYYSSNFSYTTQFLGLKPQESFANPIPA